MLAPNTFYAVRVGAGYDLYLSDATGAAAHRLNTDLDNLGWQLIATATDLNTLTQTGKYFLQATGNPNSPNTTWRYYVVVEKISDTRITQTIWQETNASLIYRRLWVDNKWTGWEQEITNAQFIAKLNGTWLGGRNYLLNSQQTRTEHGTTNFEFSPNVDLSLVRHLTLSVDVDCVNVRRTTQSGAKWFRIGAEIKITYTDNSVAYFAAWHNPPATGTNSRFGRINNRLTVPTGKTIKTIDSCVIQIWDITGDKMVVKNPKLELGHLMSDWTPAHEDTQSELEALRAEVAELKRRVAMNGNGGGSFGD